MYVMTITYRRGATDMHVFPTATLALDALARVAGNHMARDAVVTAPSGAVIATHARRGF